jgi:hypothetical protein
MVLLSPSSKLVAESSGIQPEVACPSCDDFNACTVDSCDTAFGTCRHTTLSCDDGNPCTTDSCTPGLNSTCQHTGLPLGTACDDRNSCSIADVCNGSQQCRGTFLPLGSSCTDGNGCTASDTCREGGICRGDFLNAGDSCDDGSLCTSGETCVDVAGTLTCQGAGGNCNDSNPCTQDTCNESTGLCAHSPVSCEDGNSCTGDACDPSTGGCTRTFVGGACNDGDVCTTPDACSNGNCVGAPRDCDDGVACTSDFCDRIVPGGCDNSIPIPGACDDGSPCTADLCNPTGCQHLPLTGPPCTPFDKCVQPICRLGSCGGVQPIFCSDGNACTSDGCNSSIGCVFTPISCDDQNACTVDSCNQQTGCAHNPVSCDDGMVCTVDSCNSQTGCANAPNCDDGNPCTTDACDASGCTHQPIPGAPLSIQVSLTPNLLFPANHRMIPVSATVSASDSCGGALSIRLESITSSEPDDAAGSGDGRTRNDIQGAAYGTADFTFALRAERAGEGPGRTYRVTYSVTDTTGRAAAGSAEVIAPIGRGKGPKGTGGGVPGGVDPDDRRRVAAPGAIENQEPQPGA